ncbi:hypothetical protein Tco_0027005 [Tanacetum coccineum]
MLCRPKPFYDEKNKVAIGYKNPLCLTRAKQVQSALYDGNEIVRTNHAPAVVHDSEDTLEIAEITRKRMLEKMRWTKGWMDQQCSEMKGKHSTNEIENLIAKFCQVNCLYDMEYQQGIPKFAIDVSTSSRKFVENNTNTTSQEATIYSFFKIKNLEHQTQEKDNVIRDLKVLVSKMNDRSYETYNAKDVTALIKQNECVRVKLKSVNNITRIVIPSTGVSSSTRASGSKPRSNTKHNRILPAKSVNKKKVEDHPRTNKSVWTRMNRVDSSISSKRIRILNLCAKRIWKPKGKLSNNSLNKTKRVWKATGKLFTNVGYQWRPTGKKFTLGKLNCGYQWRPTGKKFALGELCPLTRLPVTCGTYHLMVFGLRLFKTYGGESLKAQELCEKVHQDGNNHVGAIMGYGDYMIGDSVVSRAYYVEGLGHNLFSVGKFCDSDLEEAFRKHSCFVRNMDGVDLLKGWRSINLYIISVDEMLRSSPICLLSKVSKNKSWLWHHRLKHCHLNNKGGIHCNVWMLCSNPLDAILAKRLRLYIQ